MWKDLVRINRAQGMILTGSVAGLALLLLVFTMFGSSSRDRFPALPPGQYEGSIDTVLGSGTYGLFVENLSENGPLVMQVLAPDWNLAAAEGIPADNSFWQGPSWLPVVIPGPEREGRAKMMLRLSGGEMSAGIYGGEVADTQSELRGSWTLRAVTGRRSVGDDRQVGLRGWLQGRAELEDLNRLVSITEERIARQRAESQKLSELIADDSTMRTRADQKYAEAQQEVARARRELDAVKAKATQLRTQFDLARRGDPIGRVVSLSRESLARESAWARSFNRTEIRESSPQFEAAMERSKKVMDLRRQLSEEYDRLEGVRQYRENAPGAFPPPPSPPRREIAEPPRSATDLYLEDEGGETAVPAPQKEAYDELL